VTVTAKHNRVGYFLIVTTKCKTVGCFDAAKPKYNRVGYSVTVISKCNLVGYSLTVTGNVTKSGILGLCQLNLTEWSIV